jgi:hypothetical protein
MTTTHGHSAASVVPQFAPAGSLLEGRAAQDFGQLGDVLAADARLRAVLPGGLREWTGAQVIARFAGWFGDTEDFDLVEATVGEVGGRPGGRRNLIRRVPASTRAVSAGSPVTSGCADASRSVRAAWHAGECQLSQDLLRAPHSRSFYTPGHMACGDSRASRAPHR